METVGPAATFGAAAYALAEAPNGDIYMGNGAGNRISYWDVSGGAWVDLLAGGNSSVFALAFGLDGTLYFGGNFANWGGIGAADYIGTWDGTAYGALGTGADNDVYDIAIQPGTGDVWMSGYFANVGGAAADGIAYWDISAAAWVSPSSGLAGSTGRGRTVDIDQGGIVYFGGEYTSVDGVAANYISQYNGAAWTPLGDGVNGNVRKVRVTPDGIVYAAGAFTTAGDVSLVDKVAKWNGSIWSRLDVNYPGAAIAFGIAFGSPDPVVPLNYHIGIGFSTTGAGYFSGAATATNSGTSNAQPAITINRTGGTSAVLISIRNETTGKELLFDNYALLDGETLTIDLRPTQQSIISSMFGPRPDAILAGSDIGSFELIPGANNITAFVDVVGAPTIAGFITYKNTYWSLD